MRKLKILLTCLFLASISLVSAQTKTVSGTVLSSEDGQPVIGASVAVKGASGVGASTDSKGKYAFSAPSSARTLIVSMIGMKTVEVSANTNVVVNMEQDASQLEEVVIIGYGSARKISSTVGSIVNVSSEKLQEKPIANPLDALQGKVPGLQVFTSDGEPSTLSSIRLHGNGSLGASSTPLFVLDGIPISETTLMSLNTNDFENVTVLKDASATSIYGARAANGVIYISSKKGKISEKGTVTIKTQYGFSSLANTDYFNSFMNAQELSDFWVEAGIRTQAQVDALRKTYPNDTKWYKYYFKDKAPTSQTDISIAGGSNKTRYYISGSYLSQDGLRYRSDFNKYTLRTNINSNVKDWLMVGLNTSIGYDNYQSNPYSWNSTNGGLSLLALPFYSPYDANGKEYPDLIPGWNRYNPKYLADKMPNPQTNSILNTSGYIQLMPIKHLTLKSQMGLEFRDFRSSYQRLPSYKGSLNNGAASEDFGRTVSRTITNTAEYQFRVGANNNFIALIGQEYIDNKYSYFYATSTGHNDDRLMLLTAGPNGKDVNSSKSEYGFLSYFGRLEYDFAKKYYLNFSLRQDASSRFGKDNQNAMFWAAGAMWQAKKENFLKDQKWLDELTLKLSYGTSGNSEIGNYSSYALVGTNQYDGITGWGVNTPGNSQLSWEKQTQANISLSIGLIDRIRTTVELYNKLTTNMLMDIPYPYTSGFASLTGNVGKLQNRGVDFSFSVDVWKNKHNDYITPYINVNYNKDKVLELFQGKDHWIVPNTGVCYAVGKPVSYFYPIFYQVNPETGAPEWYKPGENISVNQQDPTKVTSDFVTADLEQNTNVPLYAPFNGGYGISAAFKGIYLQADFGFSLGKYLIVNDKYFFENPNQWTSFNQRKIVTDYWKKPGDIAKYPSLDYLFSEFDSRMIENASFTRLKNLTIGYTFPKSLLRATKFLTGAKLYMTGRNLVTFTKFVGPDPEPDSNLTLGVNPNTKQLSFGVELSF